MSRPVALLVALRPKQWVKNLLVFTAPLAAGTIIQPRVFAESVLTFVLFCAASSAIYLFNDVIDRESDRKHPSKRFRPIASGQVPVPVAVFIALLLALFSLIVPAVLAYWALFWVLFAYVTLQALYLTWAKHQVVLDILIVASGFGLRGVAGAAASGLEVSQWFVLVLGAASLFIVTGKRYAEKQKAIASPEAHTRRSLVRYTPEFLRFAWTLSATLAVLSYSLWAFQITSASQVLAVTSVIPFLAGLLYYALNIDRGESEAPEDVLLRDPGLLISGFVWLVVFSGAIAFPAFGS